MSKIKAKAKHVASKCGPPMGKYMNRPSIEYTGSGDQLCYDAWGGRWFRASIEAVNEGIRFIQETYIDGIQDMKKMEVMELPSIITICIMLGTLVTQFLEEYGVGRLMKTIE